MFRKGVLVLFVFFCSPALTYAVVEGSSDDLTDILAFFSRSTSTSSSPRSLSASRQHPLPEKGKGVLDPLITHFLKKWSSSDGLPDILDTLSPATSASSSPRSFLTALGSPFSPKSKGISREFRGASKARPGISTVIESAVIENESDHDEDDRDHFYHLVSGNFSDSTRVSSLPPRTGSRVIYPQHAPNVFSSVLFADHNVVTNAPLHPQPNAPSPYTVSQARPHPPQNAQAAALAALPDRDRRLALCHRRI